MRCVLVGDENDRWFFDLAGSWTEARLKNQFETFAICSEFNSRLFLMLQSIAHIRPLRARNFATQRCSLYDNSHRTSRTMSSSRVGLFATLVQRRDFCEASCNNKIINPAVQADSTRVSTRKLFVEHARCLNVASLPPSLPLRKKNPYYSGSVYEFEKISHRNAHSRWHVEKPRKSHNGDES